MNFFHMIHRQNHQSMSLKGDAPSSLTLSIPIKKPTISFFTPPFDVQDVFQNRIVSRVFVNPEEVLEFPISPSFDWELGDDTHLFALGALYEKEKDPKEWDILCVDNGHVTRLKDWITKGIQPPGGFWEGHDIVFDPRVMWP